MVKGEHGGIAQLCGHGFGHTAFQTQTEQRRKPEGLNLGSQVPESTLSAIMLYDFLTPIVSNPSGSLLYHL